MCGLLGLRQLVVVITFEVALEVALVAVREAVLVWLVDSLVPATHSHPRQAGKQDQLRVHAQRRRGPHLLRGKLPVLM